MSGKHYYYQLQSFLFVHFHQNGRDWKEFEKFLSKSVKPRPESTLTVTRPNTNNSIVQNRSKSHFVGQMSSKNLTEQDRKSSKLNISIERAIQDISSTNNKTSSNATKQVYTKFWSMPNGLNYDSSSTSSWKAQREQRAQSEIIAKQRNFENEQSDRLIEKIRRKQKLSV